MHIAMDGRSLANPALRGWDRYTVGLVRELVRAGCRVTLLHRVGVPPCEVHIGGIGCEQAEVASRGGLHWEQFAVPRWLRRHHVDLYHAPTEHGVPLLRRPPAVLTIHSVTAHSYLDFIDRGLLPGPIGRYLGSDIDPYRRSFANWYWSRQTARADHIFTPSVFARDEVIKFLGRPAERVTATPLGLPEQFLRSRRTPEERSAVLRRWEVAPPYLLYVGGFEPHKNVPGLLDVFERVRSRHAQFTLAIVGTKSIPDTLRAEIARRGLDAHVRLLCDVTGDLTDLYDGAAVFVTMSWRETFCLPALEAMSRGVPAVASAWGATPELIGDGGRVVDPRDPDAAAAAIDELLSEPVRSQIGDIARRIACGYTWSQTAERTLEVYRRLVGSSAR